MSVTFHQKLDQDSSESFQNTPQGDPAGWEAAVVTKNTKDDGVDLDNNGTITQEEKTATTTLFDTYGVDTYGEYEKLTTVIDSNNDGNLSADEYDADSLEVLDTIFDDSDLKDLTTDEKLNILQEFALSDGKNGISTDEKESLDEFIKYSKATTHSEALGDTDGVNFNFNDSERTQDETDILNGFTQSLEFKDTAGNLITEFDKLSGDQKDAVLAKITAIDKTDGKIGFLSNNNLRLYRPSEDFGDRFGAKEDPIDGYLDNPEPSDSLND